MKTPEICTLCIHEQNTPCACKCHTPDTAHAVYQSTEADKCPKCGEDHRIISRCKTPDTEWEKEFDEVIDKAWDKHGEQYEVYDPKSFEADIKEFIKEAITSRDTYWKERVEAEKKRILDICWRHCGTDASDALEEAITNEDNLK